MYAWGQMVFNTVDGECWGIRSLGGGSKWGLMRVGDLKGKRLGNLDNHPFEWHENGEKRAH